MAELFQPISVNNPLKIFYNIILGFQKKTVKNSPKKTLDFLGEYSCVPFCVIQKHTKKTTRFLHKIVRILL